MKRVRQLAPSQGQETDDLTNNPEIDERFKRIIEVRRNIIPMKEWEEIKAWLAEMPDTLVDIKNAVRQSAQMAARAKDLVSVTKTEFERYRIRYRARLEIMRSDAIVYWESEKKGGLHKQITEQMIEDRIIAQWTDAYEDLQEKFISFETLYDSIKSLQETVVNKGVDLRKLLDSETRRPASLPTWIDDDDPRKRKSNG